MALGAVLALSACEGMEVGEVPQCTPQQFGCSSGPPATASSAPKAATAAKPSTASPTDTAPSGQ
jgi:hypothetical protein